MISNYFKTLVRVVATLALTSVQGYASEFPEQFDFTLKTQTSYGYKQHSLNQQEWQLDIEYNTPLSDGELVAITRFRFDADQSLNQNQHEPTNNYSKITSPLFSGSSGEVAIRELYWQVQTDNSFWRLGKQQVIWGEADGLKLLDVINPQSFREFILDDFEDGRIPLWMVNAEFNLTDNRVLQVLLVSDSSSHEFAAANSTFDMFKRLRANNISIVGQKRPSLKLANSDFGVRMTDFVADWDFSLNYLYHYVDTPRLSWNNPYAQAQVLEQIFDRSHLFGGSASTAFSNWTIRLEVSYETDRQQQVSISQYQQSNQWSSMIGFDWQGWTDQFVSLQWFQTTVVSHQSQLNQDRQNDTLTFLWESKFLNETLSFKWLQLHSLDHHDGVIQTKLSYNYDSNLDIYMGIDSFYGSESKLFGQFDQADQLTFGFIYSL